jgi:hypothetical protein
MASFTSRIDVSWTRGWSSYADEPVKDIIIRGGENVSARVMADHNELIRRSSLLM